MTGTSTGTFDLFGPPSAGRPVIMTGQEIFRADGGKLAEIWHQEDVPGMLRQLGLEPPLAIMRLAARRTQIPPESAAPSLSTPASRPAAGHARFRVNQKNTLRQYLPAKDLNQPG
jgi:hypothetical protein